MTNEAIKEYIQEAEKQGKVNFKNRDLQVHVERFTEWLVKANYTKGFTWMGVPVIQYPTDIMAMQEIIWKVSPYVIIECGVAFGGMTVFYADMLNTLGGGLVLGIDIEIRPYNRKNILSVYGSGFNGTFIRLIEESSISKIAIREAMEATKNRKVIITLDSNHTHDHVLAELNLYAPLVTVGSYIVVFDTAIEYFGRFDKNQDRPWGPENNPATAVKEFLQTDLGKCFEVDRDIENRYLITAAPGGWLRRVK